MVTFKSLLHTTTCCLLSAKLNVLSVYFIRVFASDVPNLIKSHPSFKTWRKVMNEKHTVLDVNSIEEGALFFLCTFCTGNFYV